MAHMVQPWGGRNSACSPSGGARPAQLLRSSRRGSPPWRCPAPLRLHLPAGNEFGAVHKPWESASIRFALTYPEIYEVPGGRLRRLLSACAPALFPLPC